MTDLKAPTLEAKKPGKKEVEREFRTIRIDVKLFEPTKDSFPRFNVRELVKEERKKYLKDKNAGTNDESRPKIQPSWDENVSSSAHPFSDNEDADAARLAKKFEEKYGTGYDMSDKGAGYDENDSFIDNTEAFDEKFEDDTPCGGFYINSGPLKIEKKEMASGKGTNGGQRPSAGSYESADSDGANDVDKGKKQKKNKLKKQKRKEVADQKPCKEIAIKDMLRFQRDNLLKNKADSPKHKRKRITSDDDDSDVDSIALSETSNDSDVKFIESPIVSCPSGLPDDITKRVQDFNSIANGKTSDQVLTNSQLYQILSEIEGSKILTLDQKISIKTYLNSIVQCQDLYRKIQRERPWEQECKRKEIEVTEKEQEQKPPSTSNLETIRINDSF